MSGDPRPQHYLFAHRALPQIVYDDPAKAQQLLTGPEGEGFLSFFWRRVAEREGIPEAERMAPDGLGRTVLTGPDGTVAVVITLPTPEAYAEAHFVAAVFTPGPRKLLFFRGPPTVRYLTLEHGSNLDGTSRTVLCGWSKEGTHYNLGDGPPPEVEAFFAAILALDAPSDEAS
jgi:hypothetical protein